MNLNYKQIALIILIIAISILVYSISSTLDDNIKNILFSVSINIISSIIIIFFIDFKKEKEKKYELEEKRKILYYRLIPHLRKFDEFVLNMYKSTVSYEEMKELKYDIENVDKILEKIKLIDNSKHGYSTDFNSGRRILWKEKIISEVVNYSTNLEKFYDANVGLLTNSICDNILSITNTNLNIFTLKIILKVTAPIKTEDLLDVINIEKLIISSFKIKDEISQYYDENVFEINYDNLLRDDVSPRFKSGLSNNG